MSKIDELIQKFCPEGVEYMQLGAIEDAGLIKLGRGNVISKKDIAIEPGDYPIYSSSASGIGEFGRYGRYMFDDERLSWSVDGGGRFFYRHAHKYSVTNVSGWLKVLDSSRIDIKYLFYALDSAWSTKKFDYTKKAHPSVIRNEYKIPVPPLEVQKEIVNILDKFTQLEAELSAELSARRKQYEFYRNQLLTFDDAEVEWMTLGEVASKISSGGTPKTSERSYYGGDIPWLRTQEVNFNEVWDTDVKISEAGLKNSSAKMIPANCVIIAMYGATVGKSAINKIPLTTNQACANIQVNPDLADYRYVFHWVNHNYANIKALGTGSQTNINAQTVKNFKIPIPSLNTQRRIIAILDKFDALTNDMFLGLPAEITARRQQYEYYRTKLLTFQELSA